MAIMQIRRFRPADAGALAALFHASVREAGMRDYSSVQVIAWSPSEPDPEKYLRRAENSLVLVAENESGTLIGYGDLEANGHIDQLYCHPDHIGTGVGSALYLAIEAAAKQAEISVLFTEASEAARRMFERQGFTVENRNDFLLRDVSIHNYRMTKAIG
jgi:putative acetyltransferase